MFWRRDTINLRFLVLPEHTVSIILNRPVIDLEIEENINKNIYVMANMKS
jgi:hypothetical protein